MLGCGEFGVWDIHCKVVRQGMVHDDAMHSAGVGLRMITCWDGRMNPNTQARDNGNVGFGVYQGFEHILWAI